MEGMWAIGGPPVFKPVPAPEDFIQPICSQLHQHHQLAYLLEHNSGIPPVSLLLFEHFHDLPLHSLNLIQPICSQLHQYHQLHLLDHIRVFLYTPKYILNKL
jgi:hypothetical protein